MPAILHERELTVPLDVRSGAALAELEDGVGRQLGEGEWPVRLAVTSSSGEAFNCEVSILSEWEGAPPPSIFRFHRRPFENVRHFTCVLLVPTGIGAEIGGHAGDATPVAKLLSAACDTLITHPNVVNASDIIDIPGNALYVEGSIISRLLMGAVGLQRTRSNRVLVLLGHHDDELFLNAAINSVNAARATYGLAVPGMVKLGPEFEMASAYVGSGRAAGKVRGLERVLDALEEYRGQFDAVAISSQINVPEGFHAEYFDSNGEMVNPWGGVEAMLTHAVSAMLDVPSAHAPMLETQAIANADPGIIDPRMAAEGVSLALIQCILKGLQQSPALTTDTAPMAHPGVIGASDISCLVIPEGCLGLPVLAALEQGMKVIAVRENRNLMRNDLEMLPWQPGQFYVVENYWEAAGVMSAMRAGIDPASVRRPIRPAPVVETQG
ncbi:MAG: DUF3326 domain-containing protein [Chloroflexota bacterium]|nr:DUF3326 domain-containing protein [Chloroflexota bacterium]